MKKAAQIAASIWLCLAAAILQAETVNRIAAVVGGEVITSNELDRAYQSDELGLRQEKDAPPISKREYLGRMVEKIVVDQEVKRQGVTISTLEIEQALNRKRSQLGLSPGDFVQALRDQGLSLDDYREQIRQSLILAKLVSKEVKSALEISDQEIASYYERHKQQFLSPEKVHLYHLVVRESPDAQKTLETIQAQFQKAVPFPELAQKYSEGEEAPKGGDLGWVELPQLKPEVRSLISNLELGQISQVYQDEAGHHIFWVQGKEKGAVLSLDQVKENIRQLIYQQQFQEQYQIWLERLKAKTYIEIRL